MNIFVTGGAGFIGSHLIDRLVKDGHNITVYDNLSSGKREFIAEHIDALNPKVKLIEADLLDLDRLKTEIAGHETVFHLAANPDARLGNEQTDLDLKLETIATYNVLEAMRVNNIKKIILSSSGTIYGEVPITPIREDYGPAHPISLYGAGKVACEALLTAFAGTFDFQVWIYRFVNIIGGRATHGVIFDFIKKLELDSTSLEILGDGSQTKPYMLVNECVDGIIFGWEHASEQVNVYNLGHQSTTSVTRIAEIVREEMSLPNALFAYTGGDRGWKGDVPQYQADISKINYLGWHAKNDSDTAVRETVRRILKERNWNSQNFQKINSEQNFQSSPSFQNYPKETTKTSSASQGVKQIVVIAGGLATRLYPITHSIPKSMVPILGKPFIDYQLELFKQNGIEDVVMCVGHLHEQIKNHIGDGSKYGLKIHYSVETEKLDTGGSIRQALHLLQENFFTIYGDSFLLENYQEFADEWIQSGLGGAMAVWRNENQIEPSRIRVSNNLVDQYRKDPPPENAQHGEFGINLFKKEVLNQHAPGCFPISNFFDQLTAQNQLFAWETKQRFFEIGCPEGIADTERVVTLNGFDNLKQIAQNRTMQVALDHSAYKKS